mgnify:CR=1 FL=1
MRAELRRMIASREAKSRDYAEKQMRGEMSAQAMIGAQAYIERMKELEEGQERAIEGQERVVENKNDDVNNARGLLVEANQELKKNISPQTVAAKYSDGPFGSRGGSLGWFEREDLNPVFEEVCFTLAVSECSEPFESHLGYHIFCRSQ